RAFGERRWARLTGLAQRYREPSSLLPPSSGGSLMWRGLFFSALALERVDHAEPEAGRIGAARRVAEERRRRDRRVAEGLERVGVIGDARRDRVKLRALRKRVTVAGRDLASLAVRQIREARARELLLALLAVGERQRMRSQRVLSYQVPVGHPALEAPQAVDVVGLVLQPLHDAAEAQVAVERELQPRFQSVVLAGRRRGGEQRVQRLEVFVALARHRRVPGA